MNDNVKSPIALALAAAQAEITDPGRSKAGQVKGRKDYRYAGLDDLLQTVRPVLSRHGIAITQPLEMVGDKPFVHTKLLHASGECIDSWWELRSPGDPQTRGSEITYARRYSLEGLVGVAPTDGDDDGRGATDDRRPEPQRRQDDDRREPEPEPELETKPWTAEEWAGRLATAGLTIDEALWWCQQKTTSKLHPKDLTAEQRLKAIGWFASDAGREQVRAGVSLVRQEFQGQFYKHWNQMYPPPRKKDGADNEQIEQATNYSDRVRAAVLKAWYGGESTKTLGIRAMLKGDRGMGWLRIVTQPDFEAAVNDVLGSADTAINGDVADYQ